MIANVLFVLVIYLLVGRWLVHCLSLNSSYLYQAKVNTAEFSEQGFHKGVSRIFQAVFSHDAKYLIACRLWFIVVLVRYLFKAPGTDTRVQLGHEDLPINSLLRPRTMPQEFWIHFITARLTITP